MSRGLGKARSILTSESVVFLLTGRAARGFGGFVDLSVIAAHSLAQTKG